MKKSYIYLGCLALILTVAVYFLSGTSHVVHVELDTSGEIIIFPLPVGNNYEAKVKIKGKLSCDREVQLLVNAKPYNYLIKLEAGHLNKVIFNGDWYGDELGLEFLPTTESCASCNLKTIATFYD